MSQAIFSEHRYLPILSPVTGARQVGQPCQVHLIKLGPAEGEKRVSVKSPNYLAIKK
mgnify:CR=1 FL=1